MKRVLALLLVCLLVMTVAACAPAETTKSTTAGGTTPAATTAQATTTTNKYAIPFKDKVTISLLGQMFAPYKAEQMDIYNELEKRCNVDLVFEWAPTEGYASKVSTMLSSNALPDMFRPGVDLSTLIKEGAVEPLDAYLQYAPNYTNQIAKEDASLVRNASDGKMYEMFYIFDFKPVQVYAIRTDWLKNLNLTAPKTWDEWVAVWKAIRDGDANKNGDANDEIPWVESGTNYSSLLPVWGITSNGTFYNDAKGTYALVYDHPRYKEYLTAMQMLYKEGLVDKEAFTRTATDAAQLFNTNVAASGWVSIVRPQNTTATLSKTIPEAVLAPVLPIVGPYGDQLNQARAKFANSWVLSYKAKKDNKMESIMSFLNYVFSEKGSLLMNFGIEGTHYTMVNGKPVLKDDLLDSTFVKTREAGLIPQTFLFSWSGDMYTQVITKNKKYEDLVLADRLMIDGTTMYNKLFFTAPATLRTEAWGKYSTDVLAKVNELKASCISGKITVDQFFTEYKKLGPAGIDEINKQAQAAYVLVTK
jgi:putative aldouronate transport system substrate-binding protein